MHRSLLVASLLFVSFLLGPPASAERPLIAVLDFHEVETGLEVHEVELLGDVARGQALSTLGASYNIITRENLVDLLKAHGTTLERCQGECETETGRLIGADYVVTGRIVKAFGAYKVNLKLHRTSPPELLGAEVGSVAGHGEMEAMVREKVAKVLTALAGPPAESRSAAAPTPRPTERAAGESSGVLGVLTALTGGGHEEDDEVPESRVGVLIDVGGLLLMGPSLLIEAGAKVRGTLNVRLVQLGLAANSLLIEPDEDSFEQALAFGVGVRWYGRGRVGLDGLWYGAGLEYLTTDVKNDYYDEHYLAEYLLPTFTVGHRAGAHLFAASIALTVGLSSDFPSDDPGGDPLDDVWPVYPLLSYEISLL